MKNSLDTAVKASARYLAFSLGDEEYAVPLLTVKEVVAVPEITAVPFTPPHFLGIINLRGQIVSVMDLRKKFGMPAKNKPDETAMVIVDLQSLALGMIVDSVNEVLALSDSELSAPPEMLDVRAGTFVTGIARKNSRLILLLDIAKTLGFEDLSHLQNPRKGEAS